MTQLLKYLFRALLVCVVLYFILGIKTTEFQQGIVIFQITSFISFCIFFFVCRRTPQFQFHLIFIFQLFLSILLFVIHQEEGNSIFGYTADDAFTYERIALATKDMSLYDTLSCLDNWFDSISDYGYPLFLRIVYRIGRDTYTSMLIMLLINCLLQTISSVITYRLAFKLTNDEFKSRIASLLWGLNTASIFLNVSGRKEPLFLFLSITAMYLLYRIKDEKKWSWHLLFFSLVAIIWLFREFVAIFLILIYLGYVVFTNLYRRHIVLICIGAYIITVLFISIFYSLLPQMAFLDKHNEIAFASLGMGFSILLKILAFISPLPQFYNLQSPIELTFCLYSCVKSFLSIWGLVAAFEFIKQGQLRYYPLICIMLFHVCMISISNHALDYRFPYVVMPCFYILIVAGADFYRKWIHYSYFCFAVVLMFAYNYYKL